MSRAKREGVWSEPGSGRRLHYRLWRPPHAKTLLIIVHGFGDHGERFRTIAEELAGHGLSVAVPDHWGHGRSQGRRGDAASFETYVRDLQALSTQLFLPESGCERFGVYGHSFGGLVAAHWAMTHPPKLARMVIQSPLLEVAFPIPRWKTAVARWLNRVWSSKGMPIDLDPHALSHDPMVVSGYRSDRWVHNCISVRIYHEILRAGAEALARASAVEVPTLVLYGEADRIISIDAVHRWFNGLRCEKQIVSFPKMYHELHHEAVCGDVLRLVERWMLHGES